MPPTPGIRPSPDATSPSSTSTGLRCALYRGGSSKGAFFVAEDIPTDTAERDRVLLQVMGSPDDRQIDGIGGAHPLTSKVAVVESSDHPEADVVYRFLQVEVDRALVSDRQNCGNLLAAVGQFALERGLTKGSPAAPTETEESNRSHDWRTVAIRMANSDRMASATFPVRDGLPIYDGDTAIAGVPGRAAKVRLDFADLAGSTTGSLLPTGNRIDQIDGVPCTLIDNGMPVVVLPAEALEISGYETPKELESNSGFKSRLEAIRLRAGALMNLGDVAEATVPKMTLVAPPVEGGAISTRTFIPHRCHQAIGVFGAISVATSALIPETVIGDIAQLPALDPIVIEHPTGTFEASVDVRFEGHQPIVERAGIIRTARKLMDGTVFLHS